MLLSIADLLDKLPLSRTEFYLRMRKMPTENGRIVSDQRFSKNISPPIVNKIRYSLSQRLACVYFEKYVQKITLY